MARRKKRRLNIKNIVLAVIFAIAVISAVIAIVLAVGNWAGAGRLPLRPANPSKAPKAVRPVLRSAVLYQTRMTAGS